MTQIDFLCWRTSVRLYFNGAFSSASDEGNEDEEVHAW